MEDVAVITAYYSPYHLRAAEAASMRSPRKPQGLVCAFLIFGAACGMATVAVGFVAHSPAIIWPVVAIGLLGVVAGLVLAHWRATGSWVWGCPPSSSQAPPSQHGGTSQAAAGGASAVGDRPRGFHLPIYCADALDVEIGVLDPMTPPAPPPAAVAPAPASFKVGSVSGGPACGGAGGDDGANPAKAVEAMPGAGAAAAGPAAAAAAVEYGAVMCGFPVPGANGWIDTRPVLVLQPHRNFLVHPTPQSGLPPGPRLHTVCGDLVIHTEKESELEAPGPAPAPLAAAPLGPPGGATGSAAPHLPPVELAHV